MKPTSMRLLAVIAFVGLVCALSVGSITLTVSGALMPVRASAPAAVTVMCLALLWWTIIVRRRLVHIARAKHEATTAAHGVPSKPFVMRDKPLEPIVAARTVALAFAASRAGAYVVGWYAGVSVGYFGHLAADDVRLRLAYAGATVISATALVVVAVWLERSCKLPPPPSSVEASPA